MEKTEINTVSGSDMYSNNVHAMNNGSTNFEIANKKLMGSFENVLEPLPPSDLNSESSNANNKNYKVNLNILPIFFMELVALACLGALAYILRFTKTFPVLIRGLNCDELNAYSYPLNGSTDFYDSPANIEPVTLYSVTMGVPLVLILIGEIGYLIFSGKKKTVRGGCIGCKLHLPVRRIVRFCGIFLYGYFALGIVVDSMKLCTGRFRPYFLELCRPRNIGLKSCYGQYLYPECAETDDDQLREARMSFPSYYSAVSAYSALYCAVYLEFILSFQASSRLLRPSATFVLCTLSILCGTLRAALHFNHWDDVLVGLLLGIMVALYLTLSTLHRFREADFTEKESEIDLEKKEEKPLFFKYFRIPHVSYPNKTGNEYTQAPDSYSNNSNYKNRPSLKSADFQRDLHQRIEDFTKRQSLNSQ